MLTITPQAAQHALTNDINPTAIWHTIHQAKRRIPFRCHEVLYNRTNRLMLILVGSTIITVYQLRKKEVKQKLSGLISDDIFSY